MELMRSDFVQFPQNFRIENLLWILGELTTEEMHEG